MHSFEYAPRRRKARALAERSLQLQPDLPKVMLDVVQCYGKSDFDAAAKEFEITKRDLLTRPRVTIGAIQSAGQVERINANLERPP